VSLFEAFGTTLRQARQSETGLDVLVIELVTQVGSTSAFESVCVCVCLSVVHAATDT